MHNNKILIVEDSPTQLEYMRYLLEKSGWTAFGVENAELALEKLSAIKPDLIIVDFYLPGMLGDELCRKIRMNVNFRSIPILMLTADDSKESERHGLESGADDYLPKQVEEDILLLRIKYLLSKSIRSGEILFSESLMEVNPLLLAVDDSPTYLEFLTESLKEDGFIIEKAQSAQEALGMLQNKSYGCILIDLVMPDKDGIEFCREVMAKRHDLGNLPGLMMLTSYDSKEEMARALAAGADDFLGKNNEISVIKARIKALLRRKFIQDENRKIIEEMKNRELETEKHKIEMNAAKARASLADELEKTIRELKNEIVERKKIEEELKEQKEILEKVNRELDTFTYMVSHDLKEPLRSIFTFSDFLIEDYKDKLDAEGIDYLNRLKNSADHMTRLIDDLLSLSRIARIQNPFEKVSTEILIREISSRFELNQNDRKIELLVQENMPQIYCDPIKMKEVFSNFISNAIKYNDKKNTKIEIGIKETDPATGEVIFFIKDNGIGIEKEYFDIIFDVFRRLHGRRDYGGGTGIGLAIIKKIIEEHHGRIWLDSVPGKGTTFYFTLANQLK